MSKKFKYLFFVLTVCFLVTVFLISFKMFSANDQFESINLMNKSNDVQEGETVRQDYVHKTSNYQTDLVKPDNLQITEKQIRAMIAPHHLVGGSLINQAYASIAASLSEQNKKVEHIVLLSPNHFKNPQKIISSNGKWQTKFGDVEPDLDLITQLVENNYAQIDYLALEKEHGIFSHLPFIKNYFAESKITPLILHDDLTAEEKEQLAGFLSNQLSDDSLVVVSADFSHYLPAEAADFHDQASLAALANFDYEFLGQMDIDSQASLYVLFKYLENKSAQEFIFLDNQNAQDFISEFLAETTSYVTGYYVTGDKNTKDQHTFLFLGDMMLDRQVYQLTKQSGSFDYPFKQIDLFLQGSDYRIANLEGPITDNPVQAKNDNDLIFTFSPNFLPVLAARFEVLNLANNHTTNFGQTGLEQTREYLGNVGVASLGDPYNRQTRINLVLEKNNIKSCFFAYNQNQQTKADKVLTEIKSSFCDFKIVYTHWGKEYEAKIDSETQVIAHQFIDAGADLIIGSHPHVIGPVEEYKNKLIFYSLGNFIFDQHFSEKVETGLAVGLILNKGYNEIKPIYYLFPLKISNQNQPRLLLSETKQAVLDNLSDLSKGFELKKALKSGIIIK